MGWFLFPGRFGCRGRRRQSGSKPPGKSYKAGQVQENILDDGGDRSIVFRRPNACPAVSIVADGYGNVSHRVSQGRAGFEGCLQYAPREGNYPQTPAATCGGADARSDSVRKTKGGTFGGSSSPMSQNRDLGDSRPESAPCPFLESHFDSRVGNHEP